MNKLERSGYGIVRKDDDFEDAWNMPRRSLWAEVGTGLAVLAVLVLWYFFILLITP